MLPTQRASLNWSIFCAIVFLAALQSLRAQEVAKDAPQVTAESGEIDSSTAQPEMVQKLMAEKAAAMAAQQAGQATASSQAPKDGQAATAGTNPSKPNGESVSPIKPIQRSAESSEKADPKELSATPDAGGMLEFQFRNQPWPAVLGWLAKVCEMSLDWQELPGDTINISTRRPYTLEETKDHINRALLLRGYTMLEHEGALTVAKTEGLNPSIVPRVSPEQLSSLPPHSYVRTSFALDWLLAEEVHDEFTSMISKNGKLTPLVSTNRLEGMDAVSNLREIHDILTQEQSAVATANLAEEFRLEHARASQVKSDLEEFLGIQPSSSTSPAGGGDMGNMMQQIQMQMQQQQQQIQQQMQNMQQPGGTAGASKSSRPRSDKIFLIANDRANTLIVHAPPNKRAIIASFIKRVDVPNEMANDFERLKLRTKVFRLVSLSPRELVASLLAMDVLEPSTKLQVNEENQSVIAYASLSDQYLIQEVIDRLDGSQRSMHVIQLRRLSADSVAGSVRFLMGGSEEEDNKNQNRGFYYDPWNFNSRNAASTKKTDKMRVTANVQDNQLLLWVNQMELEEVNHLLVRLGEIPPDQGRDSTVRIVDASRRPETFEYLRQLKEEWQKISPTPLIIPDKSEFQDPVNEPADQVPKAEQAPKPSAQREKITSNSVENTRLPPVVLTSSQISDGVDSAANSELIDSVPGQASDQVAQQTGSTPPISIDIDERGNLILRSEDTAALDRLEKWMLDHRPPRREYDVFNVKFARASWVCLNLKEYFAKQKDDSSDRRGGYFWDYDYFGSSRNNDKKDEQQLGKRPELQFIYDNDTNTIVVKNADDRDRATIAELIELWDVPDPKEKPDAGMRFSRLVKLNYSRAPLILNTVKEAYRDLLSANDKTFEKDPSGESKREGGSGIGFSFKGKLSLGADEVSNRILVSAEGEELLKVVCDMIEELDEAARDQGYIQVIAVGDKLDATSLKDALQKILAPPKPPNKPAQDAGQDEAAAQAQAQAQANQKGARPNRTRNDRDESQ